MLRKIVLHGRLAQFGGPFDLDVKSPVEAIRALIVQIRGFRAELREGHYKILKGWPQRSPEELSIEEIRLRLGRANEIHIVPVIEGSSSAWGKILTGVAIIGLAIAAPYALGLAGGLSATFGGIAAIGFSGISFASIAGIGAVVALSGVAQMLSPAPTQSGGTASVDTKASFLFGSADNTTQEGVPVPLVFGEFVVGSVVISVGLSTEDMGTDSTVSSGILAEGILDALGQIVGVALPGGS